jgi:hypothetical protein
MRWDTSLHLLITCFGLVIDPAAKLSDAERAQLGAYLVEKKFNPQDRIITQVRQL